MSKNNNMKCLTCQKSLYSDNITGYCRPCLKIFNDNKKITKWKETGDTGVGTATTLRNSIRSYILESQNFRCSICNIGNNWNGEELKFILDHIDGDASNNWESNLRLVCPNCDSQLDTFKSKNKNSARAHRRV